MVLTPSPCGTSLSHYVRRGRKGFLLLLCVAEQYRGAVELCETEGLKKSTRVFITFTPIFRNKFKPLPLRSFVESRRLEPRASLLYWPERTKITHLHIHCPAGARATSVVALRLMHSIRLLATEALRFNPFPLRDFPYLTTFAGAEKVTRRLYCIVMCGH